MFVISLLLILMMIAALLAVAGWPLYLVATKRTERREKLDAERYFTRHLQISCLATWACVGGITLWWAADSRALAAHASGFAILFHSGALAFAFVLHALAVLATWSAKVPVRPSLPTLLVLLTAYAGVLLLGLWRIADQANGL